MSFVVLCAPSTNIVYKYFVNRASTITGCSKPQLVHLGGESKVLGATNPL